MYMYTTWRGSTAFGVAQGNILPRPLFLHFYWLIISENKLQAPGPMSFTILYTTNSSCFLTTMAYPEQEKAHVIYIIPLNAPLNPYIQLAVGQLRGSVSDRPHPVTYQFLSSLLLKIHECITQALGPIFFFTAVNRFLFSMTILHIIWLKALISNWSLLENMLMISPQGGVTSTKIDFDFKNQFKGLMNPPPPQVLPRTCHEAKDLDVWEIRQKINLKEY